MLKGTGYSVGPGYEVKGSMVFDIIDQNGQLVLLVREDKPFALDDVTRRRECAVYVSEEALRSMLSADGWLRKRLNLV